MNRTAGIFWLVALLIALVPQVGSAQAAPTIWDGVYTDAQAKRGQETAQVNCSACHNTADWGGSSFISAWVGQPIGELHTWIRNAMPMDSPGRLTAQEYADIVAYMLKLNKAPAGDKELLAGDAALGKIQVTRKKAG